MRSLLLALTASAFLMQPFTTMPVEYPKTGIVTSVNLLADTVSLVDCNGNQFTVHGVRNYEERDLIALIMSDNGTPWSIYDDTIIQAKYVGGVRLFAEAYNNVTAE